MKRNKRVSTKKKKMKQYRYETLEDMTIRKSQAKNYKNEKNICKQNERNMAQTTIFKSIFLKIQIIFKKRRQKSDTIEEFKERHKYIKLMASFD